MTATPIPQPVPRRPGSIHAEDLSLRTRVAAYLVVWAGYFFYCYNFLTTDYVRPFLLQAYGMSLADTARLTIAQNVGTTIGAIICAVAIARTGRRLVVTAILIGSGGLTLVNLAVHHLAGWLVLRALIGLFLGGYYVSAVGLTVALFPQRYRARMQALNSSTFSLAEIVLGAVGAAAGDRHWAWILWAGALPPLVIAVAVLFVVPDDRRLVGFGEEGEDRPGVPTGSWGEMLSRPWRRITISCVALSGLNFIAYQIFSGFVTVYLRQERGLDAQDTAAMFAAIGIGSLTGGLSWAFAADRFGRRLPLWGFVGAALFVTLYLVAPRDRTVLAALGALYGFGLSCTYVWGVWFTEIYPPHLRPFGAALFNAGHVISFLAPLAVTGLADRYGLGTAMALAPVVFLLGAGLWATLPETLQGSRAYRGWDPIRRAAGTR